MGVEKIAGSKAAEMGWDSLTELESLGWRRLGGCHLVDESVGADLHQVTLAENSRPKKRRNQNKIECKPEITSHDDNSVYEFDVYCIPYFASILFQVHFTESEHADIDKRTMIHDTH